MSADPAAVAAVRTAITGRVRVVGGCRYLVPGTAHWADWRDEDAIRCHGRPIDPRATLDDVAEELAGLIAFAVARGEAEPGATYHDEAVWGIAGCYGGGLGALVIEWRADAAEAGAR